MPDHAPQTIVVTGETTHAGELVAAGLTDAEIASELGLDVATVQRLPEVQAARLGPVHAARVERALYEASLPGTTWAEAPTREGIVRLERSRMPDTAAAKALLAAIEPARYGDKVSVDVTHRYVVALPAVADSTDAWLASLPLAGRGGTPDTGGGSGPDAVAVPPPTDFQKNAISAPDITAPQHD